MDHCPLAPVLTPSSCDTLSCATSPYPVCSARVKHESYNKDVSLNAGDLCRTVQPDHWIYYLIQTAFSGPYFHLWPKPRPVCMRLAVFVSGLVLWEVSRIGGPGECPFFEWHPYSHQHGRRPGGGVKGGRKTAPLWVWTSTWPLTSLSPARVSKRGTICRSLPGWWGARG